MSAADSDGCLPRDHLRGVLIGALPVDRPRYEPPIVTTLRHYHRRGASPTLLHRLAGGSANYRAVNLCWDIDSRTVAAAIAMLDKLSAQVLGDEKPAPGPALVFEGRLDAVLSDDERRILFMQIVVDHARNRRRVPPASAIAAFLGVSPYTIERDIDWLRGEGKVATGSPGPQGGERLVRLAVPA